MSKQEFKKTIEELVAKFDRSVDRYKDQSSSFNETQLRIEFIDPMFEALGWDMNNKAGAAEQYKEVIHEDKVYIEGKPKAPDYSFKFWGERKFFLEAKQPFVKIKTDYKPALQLRRYAWSAHLPVSILSDFEELAIYDTTIEPKATDKASVARLQYYKYTDYLNKWEEIYDLFAKESIQQGSFDKFIAKEKRGSQLVDKVFLKEIENWREWLAKDIAKLNADLTVEQLNFAVQKIIDRIIFLRIAEDRGIERYKSLENIIKSKNSYPELVRYFKTAHEKYNSGLFDFEEDTITPELKVSDKLLDKILEHLYYPNSPYEFSVLGVELLGSIYEQFLGKVIRLTAGHNAKVEEKPEVKKAGGVFYTPQYIVEYIVKNTVGELLKDKSIKQAEKIKVLDPACGSGSFLIGAYEYLLDWHLAQYEKMTSKEKEKLEKKGVIYKQVNKESTGKSIESWQLTTNEKKRIMLNNIYGVDIDKQAVEVTKLSLALKMLENENQQSINKQMKLFAERILPDMGGNIKCGNSLVGSDYWEDKDLSEVSEEEINKVNAFDWDQEFKEIMSKGGFDGVIGNPPYVEFKILDNHSKNAIEKRFSSTTGKYDLYIPFIELGQNLLKDNGFLSYITPSMFTKRDYGKDIREYISKNLYLKIYVDFGDFQVFNNVTVYTAVYIMSKKNIDRSLIIRIRNGREQSSSNINSYLLKKHDNKDIDSYYVDSNRYRGNNVWAFENPEIYKLIERIKDNTKFKLKDILKYTFQGIASGKDSVFYISDETKKIYQIEDDILRELLKGKDIRRYYIDYKNMYVIYPYDKDGNPLPEGYLKKNYPNAYKYLVEMRKSLSGRKYFEKSNKKWYELWNQRNPSKFEQKKILVAEIAPESRFVFDDNNYYFNTKVFGLVLKDRYNAISYKFLLGLMNSALLNFYHKFTSVPKAGGYFEYKTQFIMPYPIPNLDIEDTDFIKVHDQVSNLVETQLSNHKSLAKVDSETKKQLIQKQIDATDEKINGLVYKLYNLTDEEIEIIENATK